MNLQPSPDASSPQGRHPGAPQWAHLNVWWVTAADPAAVLRSGPKADRGFGRKLLALINPRWPITPIGQFNMNASTPPGRNEFYIGGFPGVCVLSTRLADILLLSQLPPLLQRICQSLRAPDIYLVAWEASSGYGAFAHYQGGRCQRAFAALPDEILEDIGVPEAFERPFWAAERPATPARGRRSGYSSPAGPIALGYSKPRSGVPLPFSPLELALAAQQAWVGMQVEPAEPTVNVVGYAVDGRPEPRVGRLAPAPGAPRPDALRLPPPAGPQPPAASSAAPLATGLRWLLKMRQAFGRR